MHTLDGLPQLHLIAHQNDVARARTHGNEISQGDLAGLIDEQIIQGFIQLLACEQPGRAGN
jgi:hypothetical protein